MRRWHMRVGCAVILVMAGGTWYFVGSGNSRPEQQPFVNVKGDGDAEASDIIEPLVVDGGLPVIVDTREPPLGPPLRVLLQLGMHQPPRPDANPDRPVRMPYADE
ncbi:MAG: hypothetical protein EXS16_04775 [Gemmataceae bacterium]|nr:hypothetical protein [Gemmataceae bacterium]